jgi:alpha-L-rhamnosidase
MDLMLVSLLLTIVALLPLQASTAGSPGAPSNLRCEYLANPAAIDVLQPRFSWVLEHTERGQGQTAYQLLVATQIEISRQDKGDQWDSGRVASENSVQVAYNGKPLESGRTYYWKVRYWDKQSKMSPYSEVARYEMGLLSRQEWKGQWIGGGGNLLRKEFSLPGRVMRARAYITALGYYELRINGEKVGDAVLDPAWTTYNKRVLYSTYDVTDCLRQGANALGVMLGGGWATLHGSYAMPIKAYYDAPALLLQVNIELEDGRQVSLVSDGTWKTTQGPIIEDNIFDGEIYDARLEVPGWDRPAFDDSVWQSARVVPGSQGILSAQMMPPIRVVDDIIPVAMTNPAPGVYVYDMGQNFSGWARLRVSGPRGNEVTLRFSELLYDNGMINRENLRGAKSRDTYLLRGEGVETYEPRFTYHGFRYVELTGFPGTPGLDTLRGRVVHSAVEPTGSIVFSKPLLNQIQRMIRWSQQSNLFGIPTDCPQRDERMGWLGDAQVTAEEAMLNFDLAAFYTNFIRDIRDTQDESGTIPDTVPHKWGERPAEPAWGTAYPLLCWYMYEQYADRRILEDNYEGLRRYVDYLRTRAPDHVLHFGSYGGMGDWVALELTSPEYVSTAYYYWDVQILSKVAAILGKQDDAQSYGQLGVQIREAFNRTFFNAQTQTYAGGTQTAQAMALYLDLASKEQKIPVAFNLYRDILYYNNTHMTTGIIGTKYLLPVLTRLGYADLAYDLATQTTYPSWGYMIAHGATALWELWQSKEGPSMNSQDHAMFGSIGAWFYQALAGINIDPKGAGYRRILIQPQMTRDLTSVSATVETVRGPVTSSWTHFPGSITLDVTIPVGSDATIVIPTDTDWTSVVVREGDRVVWEKGKYIEGVPGVKGASGGGEDVPPLAVRAQAIVLEVGSGQYSFKARGK